MQSFSPIATATLSATTSAQSVALPAQPFSSIVIHNNGTGTAYLALGSAIALPGAAFSPGVLVVSSGTSQTFLMPSAGGGSLAYIASVAGQIDVSVGTGI